MIRDKWYSCYSKDNENGQMVLEGPVIEGRKALQTLIDWSNKPRPRARGSAR